jgi:integrase
MGTLISRYEQEEMPKRYSTQSGYQSYLDCHVKPRWSDTPIVGVKAMVVESWINDLELAPKTKGNIRGLMHVILDCAVRWELTDKNPMELVRIKGGVQRLECPAVLTTEQFTSLLAEIREPFRTMVLVAGCLGLRVSEIVGLQWSDFDEKNSTLLIQRGVVHGHVGEVKTESSRDLVPIDPQLAKALSEHRKHCYPTAEGWLFANPKTGRPYHQEEIQKRHITKAATAVGITEQVGWHTFRHSYRSWLDKGGASVGVQKELMRHASIQTTMNVYGKGAMTEGKRTANSNVVEMLIREPQTQPLAATGT